MNYEELLAAKNRGRLNPSRQPIGEYYRTQVDGKYRGVVDIAPQLHSSIVFSRALRTECEHNVKLISNHQLHFQPIGDGPDIRQLEVEPGVYLSFEQLLQDNPAVVASNDFIGDTLRALVEVTNYLHAQGIRHVCYSPLCLPSTRSVPGMPIYLPQGVSFFLSFYFFYYNTGICDGAR